MWYMSYIMYINCSRNTWMFPPKPNTVSSLQPECLGCLQTLLFHREDGKAWYPTQWLSDSLSLRYLVCPFLNWAHPSKGQKRASEKGTGMNLVMAYVNPVNRLRACFKPQAQMPFTGDAASAQFYCTQRVGHEEWMSARMFWTGTVDI